MILDVLESLELPLSDFFGVAVCSRPIFSCNEQMSIRRKDITKHNELFDLLQLKIGLL